jgi:hypothetical protein
MPDKAELKRRRTQSRRDKARNCREKEEAEREEEEVRRRRAQSQRDKARHRREEEERITRTARAVQRQLALSYEPSQPAAVPVAQSSTISLVAIMEARSAKFMRDIARYLPFRLAQLYLTFIGCLMTRNTPMPRSLSTVKNYLFTNPLSARKANTSRRHSRMRSLREVQEYSHSIMIVEPPTGGCLNTCTLVTTRTIYRMTSRVRWKLNLCARFSNGYQMTLRC